MSSPASGTRPTARAALAGGEKLRVGYTPSADVAVERQAGASVARRRKVPAPRPLDGSEYPISAGQSEASTIAPASAAWSRTRSPGSGAVVDCFGGEARRTCSRGPAVELEEMGVEQLAEGDVQRLRASGPTDRKRGSPIREPSTAAVRSTSMASDETAAVCAVGCPAAAVGACGSRARYLQRAVLHQEGFPPYRARTSSKVNGSGGPPRISAMSVRRRQPRAAQLDDPDRGKPYHLGQEGTRG